MYFRYFRRMCMYLKRLESVGFKSFAERISVEFVPGVTAVVGPNGSGKSNITDAIRWVLGEQSARSLRGDKMEDIIFQGSDTRRPLNVAEVTLVLDNADQALPLDYEEISVTRRVYRSGESEFYINKQSCRLKDIIDLFMDSGLGREAFSIIGQGQVEEILSSKAEERRAIFEEAAGVLKYKHRKKKAEFKLAETGENLSRVNDIIHEIEQQLTPLETQAKTAQSYIKLKNQLQDKEISLLITEIDQLHEKWQKRLQHLDEQRKKEIKWKTDIQQREASIEKERQQIKQLDGSIEKLQEKLLTTTEQLEQQEGKKQVLYERMKHYEEDKEKLEAQIVHMAKQKKRLINTLTEENDRLSQLTEEKDRTKDEMLKIEQQRSVGNETLTEEIEDLKSDYIEYLNEQAAKRNEQQSIDEQQQKLTQQQKHQEEKRKQLLVQKQQLLEKSSASQEELQAAIKTYDEQNEAIKQLKQELERERSRFQESQQKLYQGYQHVEKIKSRKDMLEEMKEEFQGYYQGVKAILKARDQQKLTHIYGAVLELIHIPKTYMTAIETVLGGQAQNIVVQNDATARKAITWLKKTNRGRATFLPIESLRPRYITKGILSKLVQHPGYLGIAADVVSTKEEYQVVVNHLMGHVIIAKTLKDANELAKLASRRYRVVTLEGDVVFPGGSMSGGAKKRTNQSLFTREKDIQALSEKLQVAQKKITVFKKQIHRDEKQIKQKEQTLETMELSYTNHQQTVEKLRATQTKFEMQLQSLVDQLTLADRNCEQLNEDKEHLHERKRHLEHELTSIEQAVNSIQQRIEKLTEQKNAFHENKEQLDEEFHRLQVIFAEQDERVKYQREKTDSLQRQVDELNEQHETYTNELQELIRMKESEIDEQEIAQNIVENQQRKETLLQRIQDERSERAKRSQRLQDQEREVREENKQQQAFVRSVQEIEVEATRLDVELDNRLQLLETEYTITYEKAKKTYQTIDNIRETKQIVEELKHQIKNLGTVNLGAIDEYERVSERYSFLTVQKNDLEEAKQTLYEVIAEMDEEMEKLFGQTFQQIKEEFTIVFKQLFGGGKAELKLTDPQDLLGTGVEIVAQPPGKKLQNLGLLSGGEKALTAIALLFAILRVRPVPFCVLDEVEASLDEANVVRFAKYLDMHSDHTQFIVITHRKGTMEEADVLYGVTMQESGVSRLVSVRLEETEEIMQT